MPPYAFLDFNKSDNYWKKTISSRLRVIDFHIQIQRSDAMYISWWDNVTFNSLVTVFFQFCSIKPLGPSWPWSHLVVGFTITTDVVNSNLDSGRYSFSRVWSSTITPSTKGSMCFIILNASSKEDFEFLLESVNQWDTLCTYHYLNKATTTIISTSNIFIMVGYNCFIIFLILLFRY